MAETFEDKSNAAPEYAKTVSETRVETVHLVRFSHLNDAGCLFGGTLMQWMDEIAALSAMQFYDGSVVTGSVDSLVFIKGAQKGDQVKLTGWVTRTGHSSMEIRVDVHAGHPGGKLELINTAYFVMVSVSRNGQPKKPLPKLILETDADRLENENAEIRDMIRKERRQDNI